MQQRGFQILDEAGAEAKDRLKEHAQHFLFAMSLHSPTVGVLQVAQDRKPFSASER